MHAHRVPHHEIRVLDGAVGLRPDGETVSRLRPCRIRAGRVPLAIALTGHPELISRELSAHLRVVIWREQRGRAVAGSQLIADRIPHAPVAARVDHTPERRLRAVRRQLALRFCAHRAGLHDPDTLAGTVLPEPARGEAIHDEAVLRAVHIEIEPEREK